MIDNPLAALGPIAWETVDCNALDSFLSETFACAQIIADSVPTTTPAAAATTTTTTGRPRSQTDGAVSYNPGMIRGWGGAAAGTTPSPPPQTSKDDGLPGAREKKLDALRQSWKEVKTGANARDVVVYKMNGGREGYAGSSWFARRSLHKRTGDAAVDVDFDTFKRGLLHEFDLGVPRGKNPTPVRTMVTRKCVEHHTHHAPPESAADSAAHERALQIFLLEADFPGPTASRDFVTMLLTAQSTLAGMTGPCRQFMMVSKPCQHPATPPRSGFVRAQYESVELIREVPIPKAEAQSLASAAGGRRTRSSIDLPRTSMDDDSQGHAGHAHADTHEMAIEWIMITRNNPGGNVPRFLVDRSTPSSIISDANKFLDWLLVQDWATGEGVAANGGKGKGREGDTKSAAPLGGIGAVIHEEDEDAPRPAAAPVAQSTENDVPSLRGGADSSTRLFNMLAGALGGASTTVTSKLASSFEDAVQVFYPELGIASVQERDTKDASDVSDSDLDDSLSDDTGGDVYSDVEQESVESAADRGTEDPEPAPAVVPVPAAPTTAAAPAPPAGLAAAAVPATVAAAVASPSAAAAAPSIGSSTVDTSPESTPERDTDGKSTSSKTKDERDHERHTREMDKKERHAQKLLEKHNKAVARREAQFQKELQKLEQKRRQQADKEAARVQKIVSQQADGAPATKQFGGLLEYTQRELERAAVQIESLQKEVRQLEAENRRLKAREA